MRRWPSLSERKPQHFLSNRAQSSTPEVMDNYFQKVQVILKINNYTEITLLIILV